MLGGRPLQQQVLQLQVPVADVAAQQIRQSISCCSGVAEIFCRWSLSLPTQTTQCTQVSKGPSVGVFMTLHRSDPLREAVLHWEITTRGHVRPRISDLWEVVGATGDSLCMEVLNAAQQLHKASAGVCLIVAPPLQQRVQKLSACQQLCDEVHLQRTTHTLCLGRRDACIGTGMHVHASHTHFKKVSSREPGCRR